MLYSQLSGLRVGMIVLLAVTLAGVATLRGQSATPDPAVTSTQRTRTAQQDSAEIRAIIAADNLLNAAAERGDSATLDRLLAPEFVLVSGRGHVLTKQDNLRTLLADLDFDVMRAFDFQVELFGESAVVVHKGESCGRRGGTPFTGAGEGMHIFVKRAGQWQVAVTHEGRRRVPTQLCPAPEPSR